MPALLTSSYPSKARPGRKEEVESYFNFQDELEFGFRTSDRESARQRDDTI